MQKENIKQIRTVWRMSQEEFAQRLGVTRNVVVNWETGRTPVDAEYLHLLSRLSGLPADQIDAQEIPLHMVPTQPLVDYFYVDRLEKRLLEMEALLTRIANKLDI